MHRIRITLIVVVLLAILAMATIGVQGSTLISLWFQTDVHGRPCEIHVYQVETTWMDPDADAPRYEIEWIIEVEELDDSPPTITPMPTVNPTVTPGPTSEPVSGLCSLKTSNVFHSPDCRYVKDRNPSELDYWTSCQDAIDHGKRACKSCDPCE